MHAFRWRIRRLVRQLDNAAGEWIGWSRLPLGIEPVPADPLVCWCIRCGSSVGTGEATESGCHRCRNRDLPFSAVVRLGCLEAELRSLLLGLKYSGWWEVAQPLGRMLADRLRPVLGDSLHTSVIVPMPMPAVRRLVRTPKVNRMAISLSLLLGCLAPADLAGILILALEGYPFWKLSENVMICARLNFFSSRGIQLFFFKMKVYVSFML